MELFFGHVHHGDDDAGVTPIERHIGGPRTSDVRPWVTLNMVTSVDGASAIEGVSELLGGPGDAELFSHIRALADVIVAGGETVRAENYRMPRLRASLADERERSGRTRAPGLAVVSRSLDFAPDAAMFDGPGRPIFLTSEPGLTEGGARWNGRAEVVAAWADRVDPAAAVGMLGDRGAKVVLLEGGPRLNAEFVAADLVDEVFVSVSPHLVAGGASRIVAGGTATIRDLSLVSGLRSDDGTLFLRYQRDRST